MPGAKAPKLVTNDTVAQMKPGAVLVDIAIDQGGCFEDSRPTTHDDPTFTVHESVFYCVANMPGGTADVDVRLDQCDHALRAQACRQGLAGVEPDAALAKGLSTHDGQLLNAEVARDLDLRYTDPAGLLAQPRPRSVGSTRAVTSAISDCRAAAAGLSLRVLVMTDSRIRSPAGP